LDPFLQIPKRESLADGWLDRGGGMESNIILTAIGVVLVGMITFSLALSIRMYWRFRGQRLITCPETKNPAAVRVNVAEAARKAFFGKEQVRLDQCSRWPERRNCGQECLTQVHADREHCLVWNIVADWYKGKSCAYCQKPFAEMHWHDRHPGLLSPERVAKQWNEIPPETLPEAFATHLPVCWDCYIAETFRRQNPDRVLDRSWERGPGGEYVPNDEGRTATNGKSVN
jgi:hypothetical protein